MNHECYTTVSPRGCRIELNTLKKDPCSMNFNASKRICLKIFFRDALLTSCWSKDIACLSFSNSLLIVHRTLSLRFPLFPVCQEKLRGAVKTQRPVQLASVHWVSTLSQYTECEPPVVDLDTRWEDHCYKPLICNVIQSHSSGQFAKKLLLRFCLCY